MLSFNLGGIPTASGAPRQGTAIVSPTTPPEIIRAVIALHNLVNNKLVNKEQERSAEEKEKEREKEKEKELKAKRDKDAAAAASKEAVLPKPNADK